MQIKDLNSGTFGFVQLALDRTTGRNVVCESLPSPITGYRPDLAPLDEIGRNLNRVRPAGVGKDLHLDRVCRRPLDAHASGDAVRLKNSL